MRDRIDGLADEPRPGTPRRITDEQVEQVVVRTLETTPPGATHWSTRTMARAAGLSDTTVSRMWRAFGLQPHRTKTFKLSPDPWLTHKTPAVVRWPVAHPRFYLHFTPTYASWLNLVERWFPALTTSRLRRGIFRSVVALERAIRGVSRGAQRHRAAVRMDEVGRRDPGEHRSVRTANARGPRRIILSRITVTGHWVLWCSILQSSETRSRYNLLTRSNLCPSNSCWSVASSG